MSDKHRHILRHFVVKISLAYKTVFVRNNTMKKILLGLINLSAVLTATDAWAVKITMIWSSLLLTHERFFFNDNPYHYQHSGR